MAEEKEKLVFIATYAEEEPEKACFPFLLANAAQSMDMEAVVALQSNGVYLAQKGYAEKISVPGFTPLKEMIDSYVANGGKLLA
jgi:predicted peroxiredoxin